jgi:hypothetical protein
MAERVDGLGVVVTREDRTVALYRRRVQTLGRKAMTRLGRNASLLDIIEQLGQADGEFAPATIRQYFAALTWAVDAALECSVQSIEITNQCREALAQRPQPRPKDAEKRTSARKRKNVAPQELHAVCMFLRKRKRAEDLLLLYLLINGVVVALRPSEYSDADVQGDLLVVRCKKDDQQSRSWYIS